MDNDRIKEFIKNNPPVSIHDIAKELDLEEIVVLRTVEELLEAKVIKMNVTSLKNVGTSCYYYI